MHIFSVRQSLMMNIWGVEDLQSNPNPLSPPPPIKGKLVPRTEMRDKQWQRCGNLRTCTDRQA